MKNHLIIPIFVPHEGCQYNCIYCNQKKITGRNTPPDIPDMTEMIEAYLHLANPGAMIEIAFYGGSFTALDQHLQKAYLQAVQIYLHKGLIQKIRISTRPDAITPAGLDMLADHGVETIELGVQSLDRQVLKASGRPYEPALVKDVSLEIKRRGFVLGHQIMIGLPESNRQKEIETVQQVVEIGPQLARIYPTLVIKGTQLANIYRIGEYRPLSLNEAVDTSAYLLTMLEKVGIKVIRMGLQATSELTNPETVLAGPFHPSFGELVEARVFLFQAIQAIGIFQKGGTDRELKLFVNSRDISKLIGQKRINILALKDRFHLDRIGVQSIDDPETGWVGVAPYGTKTPQVVLTRQGFYEAFSMSEIH